MTKLFFSLKVVNGGGVLKGGILNSNTKTAFSF